MELGKYNTLEVVKLVDFGAYLDGGDYGNILVPKRYLETPPAVGDQLSVFIYRDSEDRLVGTTETPIAQTGEFACLKVTGVSRAGAFLDWGLMKDVLVPHSEQVDSMQEGRSYVVYLYVDEASDRIVASAKTQKFLSKEKPQYSRFAPVSVLVEKKTDLGYRCIVDDMYQGMLYHNQVFRPLKPGDRLEAFSERVRPDGKIDLLIEKPGLTKVEVTADKIMELLQNNEGFIALTDQSSPDEITALLNTSKKTFKKAAGLLYKEKKVTIEDKGIRLNK